MLSISSGHSVEYLTDQVATGRESYYTGAVAAGEPPGRWYGTGAEQLGLSGLVDHQDVEALYERFIDPRDPAFRDKASWDDAATLGHTGRAYKTAEDIYAASLEAEPHADPERQAQLLVEAGKKARQNVAFYDATFSVQKSVTVLHTAFEAQEVAARNAGDQVAAQAWGAHRQAVEDAVWAGNNAMLDFMADKAGYSRVGHHGGAAGRYTDAHDWTVASFFQHDSRDHDPQLHIHNAILNRVQGADGVWRTLDSRAIHKFRGAAAAVGERTTEEHLTRSLGVALATRPDGKAREIVGVDQVANDLFSSRRRTITPKTAQLVAAYESKHGRRPNSLELDRLMRQATMATRRAKTHDGETISERLDRWDAQLRAEVADGLAGVANNVLALAGKQPKPAPWRESTVIATALADVQEGQASWTASDLTRAISNTLPDHLGGLDGRQITELLDGLTTEALKLAVPLDADQPGHDVLPDALKRADGRSAYEQPGGRRYATPEHIHTERLLLASTTRRGAPTLSAATANGFIASLAEAGVELGVDQAAAVRGILTSGAAVESLVGPAGTGKSFVVGTLAKAWTDPGLWDGRQRRVVGLATSQIATNVLADQGLNAANIARWLGAQRRLAPADATNGRPPVGEDRVWRLHGGDLIVVDESSMVSTADLAAIHGHAQTAGAKLLLTGDHRQLSAVGAGGAMELLADAGNAYELTEARRFHHQWERAASLRLRDGDPSVLEEYHRHGRIVDGGTIEQTEAAAGRFWLADTLAGRHSILIVDTNEQAARMSSQLRDKMIRLGRVEEAGVPLGLQGTIAGVGDTIEARKLGWDLIGYEGNRHGPVTREQYRVLATRDDGGLLVAPILGDGPAGEQLGEQMALPGSYVSQHVALGYAVTVHSGQGLDVGTSIPVITNSTSAEAAYVGLSRGRYANTAFVATRTVPADAPTGEVNKALHRSPMAVLAGILERADPELSALQQANESAVDAASIHTPAERFVDAVELATAGRTPGWLDQLTADGHLSVSQRGQLAAEDGATTLARLLRRAELAGHDPHQVLHDAVTSGGLGDARSLTNVLHHRIIERCRDSLDPAGDTYAAWTPQVTDPSWARYLDKLAADADTRRTQLGDQAAADPPRWALEALGPVPAAKSARGEWADRAGMVAAHRELTGHDDPDIALPAPPAAGQGEAYASWRAAWRALGRPDYAADEAKMADGKLRLRVRAYEREKTWAPAHVANELAGTRQTAARHRQTATLRTTQAAASADPASRSRLQTEAADAAALAGVLEERVGQLEQVDNARAEWLAHTAMTRANADRAAHELSRRHAGDTLDERPVTAGEWLAEHQAAMRAEDPHRDVVDEHDLTRLADREDADVRAVANEPDCDAADLAGVDIREATAEQPAQKITAGVRVPAAKETADNVQRAQAALTELEARQADDERRAAEEARNAELARWHTDDADQAARAQQATETIREMAAP